MARDAKLCQVSAASAAWNVSIGPQAHRSRSQHPIAAEYAHDNARTSQGGDPESH